MRRKVVVGFAHPGKCSRSSYTQETRGRLASARTIRSPTCSGGHSHWVRTERSSISFLSFHVQLPGSSIPQPQLPFLQLPAVGHEMEIAAGWHRGTADCRQGVTVSVLAWLSLPTPLQCCSLLRCPHCQGLRAGTCWRRASTPVPCS